MELSIVIPAYNEEKRIESTLKEIIMYCKENFTKYEILVVNDCSKDRTKNVVEKYKAQKVKLLHNGVNRGKGYSVRKGILAAKYPFVLFTDSDMSTPITDIKSFLPYLKSYDIIIASRNLKGSKIKVSQPFYRKMMGKAFPFFVNLFVLRGFKDTQCGFKLFKIDAAKKIVALQTFERFSFDVEILFIAKKLGYRIKELPVTWVDKAGSKVSPIKDAVSMLTDLFKIRWNQIQGRYKPKKN